MPEVATAFADTPVVGDAGEGGRLAEERVRRSWRRRSRAWVLTVAGRLPATARGG